ncbi:hypothetical protein NJB18091_22560 [Mycobacterium marinum]|nr:hypothetical protein NJB18091_22560 [Mycobacterium marinum]
MTPAHPPAAPAPAAPAESCSAQTETTGWASNPNLDRRANPRRSRCRADVPRITDMSLAVKHLSPGVKIWGLLAGTVGVIKPNTPERLHHDPHDRSRSGCHRHRRTAAAGSSAPG